MPMTELDHKVSNNSLQLHKPTKGANDPYCFNLAANGERPVVLRTATPKKQKAVQKND